MVSESAAALSMYLVPPACFPIPVTHCMPRLLWSPRRTQLNT
jgi:hypothetical protein